MSYIIASYQVIHLFLSGHSPLVIKIFSSPIVFKVNHAHFTFWKKKAIIDINLLWPDLYLGHVNYQQ